MNSINLLLDALGAFFQGFWFLWAPLLLIFLFQVALKLYKNARLAQSGIAELDQLEGEDFERYLELLFRKLGYRVIRTPYQGDYGADLVIQKEGVQTVVQAKRYNRSVGVKAIQEAVAAKDYYKANRAMVVTNSYYSQQAKKLAAANQVELWDREALVKQLLAMKQTPIPVASPGTGSTDPRVEVSAPVALPSIPAAACATCGKAVSPQVSAYCLRHPERFGGQIYCYDHQKRERNPMDKVVKSA